MANLSPEVLEKIAAALPETYATNPDQFVQDWEAGQQARQEVDGSRELRRWYDENYKPWWQNYGGDFTAFQEWKQSRDHPEPDSHGPESIVQPDKGFDWNDVDAPRRSYETLETRLNDLTQKMDAGFGLVNTTIQSRVDEMQRLLALQEQAYSIINEATWNRIQPGWRPDVNIPDVVRHAQQHNIPDLRRAYEHFSQGDREKAIERAAYERGKEEGARAAAAQSVTTEMGAGTPFHHSREPERRRGYGIAHDDIIAQAHTRTARRVA